MSALIIGLAWAELFNNAILNHKPKLGYFRLFKFTIKL